MQRVMMSATALAIGMMTAAESAADSRGWKCTGVPENQGSYHPNGGGWVEHTARVADTAYIGPKSCVSGRAEVSGNAALRGDSIVGHNAVVSGNAVIRDAYVTDYARVYGNARLTNEATAHGRAHVYGNAKIANGVLVWGSARVYGSARVTGPDWDRAVRDHISITGEVFGSAVVRRTRADGHGRYELVSETGRVNCGRWNIPVTTDRRGECGRNGKAKVLTLPDLPGINPGNTETAESTDEP